MVAGEGAGDSGKQLGGEPSRPFQIFPMLAAEMDEDDAFNFASAQIAEQFLRRKMGEFADEQVERAAQERFEVLRPADVRAVADAPPPGFDEKAKGVEALRVLPLKSPAQRVEMRGAERGDADAAGQDGFAGAQGVEIRAGSGAVRGR